MMSQGPMLTNSGTHLPFHPIQRESPHRWLTSADPPAVSRTGRPRPTARPETLIVPGRPRSVAGRSAPPTSPGRSPGHNWVTRGVGCATSRGDGPAGRPVGRVYNVGGRPPLRRTDGTSGDDTHNALRRRLREREREREALRVRYKMHCRNLADDERPVAGPSRVR